jgi:hypothetical protein
MHFLCDYASYMYWIQFEMFPFGLALKVGLHLVTVAHMSPGPKK